MAFSSAVVLIINVEDLAVPDLERQPPVARDVQAPNPFASPAGPVSFPLWEGTQSFRIPHVLEEGQHCAELVHSIRLKAFGAVLQVELFQAFMDEVPYLHPVVV
jgi:hypothetical protein